MSSTVWHPIRQVFQAFQARIFGIQNPALRFGVCLSMLGLSILGLSILGCGRVGNIRPPEATAPAPVQFFMAEGQPGGVLLTWQNPTLDASGGALKSLDRYYVERSDYLRGEVPDFSTIAQIVPTVDSTESENGVDSKESDSSKKRMPFGAAAPSGRLQAPLTYLDNSAELGKRYDYRVVAVTESGVRGRSDLILRVSFEGAASRIENIAVQLRK